MTRTRLFHLITAHIRGRGITARNITIDILALVADRLRNSSGEEATAGIFREDLNPWNDTWQTARADALLNNPTIAPYYLNHRARNRTHYVFAQQPGQQAYTLSLTTLFRLLPNTPPSQYHVCSATCVRVRRGGGGLCINDARNDAFAREHERRLRKRRLLRSRILLLPIASIKVSVKTIPYLDNSDLSAARFNYAAML